MRLDRFLIRCGHTNRAAMNLLREERVWVDGEVESQGVRTIDKFSRIEVDGVILQNKEALYFMLHKPPGYLSATTDPQHPTVLDLVHHPLKHELHLAGRLDRASTGLVILTNDGRWSKGITEPLQEIPKVYRVTTRDPISSDTAAHFKRGIYFAYEDLTTRPATLEIVSDHAALITLCEGRYHQIKRMFHAVGNQVTGLHRESIGGLRLGELAEGHFRPLVREEIALFTRH